MTDERMPGAGIPDPDDERRLRWLVALTLAATAIGGAIDLMLDAPDDWLSFHVLYEVALIAATLLVMLALSRKWLRSRRHLGETRRQLAEREAWARGAEASLAALGRAIDDQLRAWKLTDAERVVAVMLLKGRSHKEIAAATERSERTVRQHAVTIYQKSGLHGRAELAAFFLEGLPRPDA